MRTMEKVCGLVAALSIQSAAADYSNMIFFGDSLSDSGSYLPLLIAADPTYSGEGKFTTTPGNVWSENIAERYGFDASPLNQGGTNYAQGGARIQGDGYLFSSAMPLVDQVNAYLSSTNGQADGKALYTVWAGGNDFLWIMAGNEAASDIPAYLNNMIATSVSTIASLENAGARYILVPNVPDVTNTPTSNFLTAAETAQLSALTKTYNEQLFAQAAASGLTIIAMDIDTLFSEMKVNPSAYGFTNASTALCPTVSSALYCIAGETYTAGDELAYAFADFAHPTAAGHTLISDYAYSLLTGSALTRAANELTANENLLSQQNLHTMLRNAIVDSEADSLWIDATTSRTNQYYDNAPLRLSVGVLIPQSETTLAGFALHMSDTGIKNDNGDVDSQSIGLSLFQHAEFDRLQLNSSMMVSSGQLDLNRNVQLFGATRKLRGDTDSLSFGLQSELGYQLNWDKLQHGPLAGLAYQYTSIDGYKEKSADGSTSTSLAFDDHTHQSTRLYAGWHFGSANAITDLSPYLDVTWHYRVNENNDSVEMALIDYRNNKFTTPEGKTDKSYGLIETGANWALNKQLSLQGHLSYRVSNKDKDDLSASLSAQFSF